jgi:hypothetical protein
MCKWHRGICITGRKRIIIYLECFIFRLLKSVVRTRFSNDWQTFFFI